MTIDEDVAKALIWALQIGFIAFVAYSGWRLFRWLWKHAGEPLLRGALKELDELRRPPGGGAPA